MRKPLYRAKAINRYGNRRTNYKDGDWVYGLVSKINEFRGTITAEMTNEDGISGIDVEPKTICEFTGKIDKNGKQIFEGDILKLGTGEIRFVFYGCTSFRHTNYGKYAKEFDHKDKGYEVIGNIYDNQELLGGEDA